MHTEAVGMLRSNAQQNPCSGSSESKQRLSAGSLGFHLSFVPVGDKQLSGTKPKESGDCAGHQHWTATSFSKAGPPIPLKPTKSNTCQPMGHDPVIALCNSAEPADLVSVWLFASGLPCSHDGKHEPCTSGSIIQHKFFLTD